MTSVETSAADGQEPVSVFLSYSRGDLARATPVIKALQGAGFNVWWDGLLGGGTAFAKTTETALETANAVVVLWSAQSVQSHWVRDEATRGRDRQCLVPVSIDGTAAPLGFGQIQHVDLSKWRGKAGAPAITELIEAVRAVATRPGTPRETTQRKAAKAPPSRRAVLIGGGVALTAVGGGVFAWQSGLFGGAKPLNSVAVLPFKNLSGDPAQDYFSDGLSEELRTTLSASAQLQVTAQTSSSSDRFKGLEPRAIAARLGVAHLLDGSVRRNGNILRIAAQLIDGTSGVEQWAQSFDRNAADVFAVQSEIANLVTDALAAKLSTDSTKPGGRAGSTNNPAAFDAYLRGKALYRLAASETSDRNALAAFERAITLDPAYAAAHAGRSRVLTVIANNYASGGQLKAQYDMAIEAARNATRLAPDLAEAQSALGFALLNGRLDLKAAAVPYQKSFELGFGNADILSGFANFAARIGKIDDAQRAIGRAQKLDPLNPAVFRNAGLIEYSARRYADAFPKLRTALSLNPKAIGVYVILGDINLVQGKPAEAIAAYDQEPGALGRLRGLAVARFKTGDPEAAKAAMAKLVADFGDNSLYQQGQVLAQWGQPNDAILALQRAYAAGDSGLVQLQSDPLLDPLRDDRRFIEIRQNLGFE